ncbi:protein-methionine-sulfoxide reductase heme-binding subunit MsrQ [Amylibacter sp. SFDW26]|uniref:protein-methionine-sulfoxide reductase heme-binding subunit MsrQ n=1 Tax=Amylibacter sp. SFDW26 TaxID=2652722 RepID=UPI0012614DDB|nr:protein-methionine-sulfoxide reductase heme-binding subunit MsrQ [Amylibacter sp. SFDW26]KAB7610212.1 protein-methionine-sulfoxide reductase heme-binding subunit MsrQ [Amylibacter sp. SFDW26]
MAIVDVMNAAMRRIPAWPLYIVLTVPGLWLFYQALNNQLGADPLKTLEHQLGVYALQLLVASLLITPLRNILSINLIKYRRAIGLMAFFYTAAHLLTYLWLDQQWWWDAIIKDLTKRPYIIIGFTAFLAMVPLAITSNNTSIKRLGAGGWKKLHRLAYYAALGGAVHYVLLEKTWQREPILYVLIVVALLGYRYVKAYKGTFFSGHKANG